MKHLVLMTTLLAAGLSLAADSLEVRYREPVGRMSLTVSHDIQVQRQPKPTVEAARDFAFDLVLAKDPEADAVTVTIDRAKASYEAHERKQRLGTRQLNGQSFSLAMDDDGRRLDAAEPTDGPQINLGPVVEPGFSVADALVDALPTLPPLSIGEVSVGTTWTTERTVRSLEGWTWGAGTMTSRHRVTSIDRRGDRAVVRVVTEAEARLGPVVEGKPCSAELKRTLSWSFDASAGRLLTLKMDQEAESVSTVPQGEIRIIQHTRVELTPTS